MGINFQENKSLYDFLVDFIEFYFLTKIALSSVFNVAVMLGCDAILESLKTV